MAETKIKKVFGHEMDGIDFSSHHNYFLKDDDGTFRPMDENYFEATLRAPGVWQILTYGDYIYLVEGENEALVIDTGFGIGDLRKMCQTLTDKPITRCVITHEHFDHTGGCSYFEKSYMTETCAKAVKTPGHMGGKMLAGIEFPLDFDIEIVEDGYIFDLGGRELEVFCIPDHADGSLALLDRKNRLLFSGDELGTPAYKAIRTTVEQYCRNVTRLYRHFQDIDLIFGGGFVYDGMLLFRQKHCLEMILNGYPGQTYLPPKQLAPRRDDGTVWDGRRLHDQIMFTNALSRDADQKLFMTFGYCTVIYYKDRIFDEKK